jgi:hypothetical protein
MPAAADLLALIAVLSHRNAVELQDRHWREDVDALVDVLEGCGGGAAPAAVSGTRAERVS